MIEETFFPDAASERLIDLALSEELNDVGDLTTTAVVHPQQIGRARLAARGGGLLAGLSIARWIFRKVDAAIAMQDCLADGDPLTIGDTVAQLHGPLGSILIAQRTALNFLQCLSSVATRTAALVQRLQGTRARIIASAQTSPGMRCLQAYAVRVGGGHGSCPGLSERVLLTSNHLLAARASTGSATSTVAEIVEQCRKYLCIRGLEVDIVVEITSPAALPEVLAVGVKRIALQQMTLEHLRRCVEINHGQALLEVVGPITLDTVADIAATGVDFIAIATSAPFATPLNFSLELSEF